MSIAACPLTLRTDKRHQGSGKEKDSPGEMHHSCTDIRERGECQKALEVYHWMKNPVGLDYAVPLY